MPKTKNISRAQWDLATQSTAANTNPTPAATAASNILTSTLATALSPPTRPRLHAAATRTNSNSTTSTRHRRSKENSENGGGEKENAGRLGRSTRTHVTPGVSVLSTTFGPGLANIASAAASGKKLTEKPSKPTKTVRKLKKTPLQDVTSQFVATGMGEGANRTGTAFESLEEEDILAAREAGPGEVIVEAPAVEATPSRPRKETAAPSPLPPSSPPSDFRLPASLEFNLPAPAKPVQDDVPIEEYDGWRSFDSAIPVASPSRPVTVADEEDPFGFAALERKLKVERAAVAFDVDVDVAVPAVHEEAQDHHEDEDEDIHLLVADTSSPRPEGLLKRRSLKRALEEEMDHEEDDEQDALNAHGSSPASNNNVGVASLILSSPVRAAIVAAAPASTPAAAAPAEGSPAPVTPPTPHKDNHHKRRRISGVPEVEVDVFGPCLATSSSSPATLQAESPSPTKGSVRRPAHGATGSHLEVDVEDAAVHGDALDVFNATLDAEEIARDVAAVVAAPGTKMDEGRTLRPRASRSNVALAAAADEKTNGHADADAAMKSAKKARSASRGRGRGVSRARGASKARGASRSKSMSARRARQEGADEEADKDDNEDLVVDEDEKFEQERQARIAYFRGLDDYQVEKEDVYLI